MSGRRRTRQDGDGGGRLILCVDGAIRPGSTGLGVVVRDGQGRVVTWRARRVPRVMTCNEAEYEALLFGLETVRALRPAQVEVRTDSQVNGEWRGENGEWRMERGEWRMENGEWRMENG